MWGCNWRWREGLAAPAPPTPAQNCWNAENFFAYVNRKFNCKLSTVTLRAKLQQTWTPYTVQQCKLFPWLAVHQPVRSFQSTSLIHQQHEQTSKQLQSLTKSGTIRKNFQPTYQTPKPHVIKSSIYSQLIIVNTIYVSYLHMKFGTVAIKHSVDTIK